MQLPILSEPIFRANLITVFSAIADKGVNPAQCRCDSQGNPLRANQCPLRTQPRCFPPDPDKMRKLLGNNPNLVPRWECRCL